MFTSKKLTTVFGLMTVLSLLLSACGGATPEPTKPPAPTTAPSAVAPTSAPPTAAPTTPPPTALPTPEPSGPKPGGTLILGIRQEPSSLDPQGSANAVAQRPLSNLYDSLVWLTPEGEVKPWLATSWEVSDDGKVFTFQLRKDVKFHDGTPFTAEAVQVTLDRISDPDIKSTSAKSAIGPYDHTEIVDDYTVKIHMKAPYGPMFYALSQAYLGIVSPTAVQKYGNKDFLKYAVGTGPFMLEEYVPQDHITLVRNPDYHWAPEGVFENQGPAYLDKIIIRTIPEASTRLAALLNDEVNVIEPAPYQELQTLEQDPNYYVVKQMHAGTGRFLFMNTKKFPTDDVNVRRAIIYAIDNEAIRDLIFFGAHPAGRAPLTPATPGYDPRFENIYTYDPAKASQLLEEAGWQMGSNGIRVKDGKPLELVFYVIAQNPDEQAMAEFVQGQLRQVGIDAKLNSVARAAWYEGLYAGDHNLVVLFLIYGDPDALRLVYNTGAAFNFSLWSDPETDRLLEEGFTESDPAKRFEIYGKVQDIVMDQALVATLVYENNLLGISKNVQGITFDITAYPIFYGVYITD